MRRVFLGPDPAEVNGVEIRAEAVVVQRGGETVYGPDYADRDLWREIHVSFGSFVSPPTGVEALRWIETNGPVDLWILQPVGWCKTGSNAELVERDRESVSLMFRVEHVHRTEFVRTVEDMGLDDLRGEVDYVQ